MENEVDFFKNGDYKFIMNLIDKKITILNQYEDFNEKYLELLDIIEDLEITLEDSQKEKFNEIVRLFYNIEEYYLALAYSLGVKYCKELEKL